MNTKSDIESRSVAELSPPTRSMKFTYSSGERPLDGYTIKRGIGCGGFGEVYYAISDGGKEVALKLVQRHLDVEMRGVSQCLNLKHPNLVLLYDVKQTDSGERWVVMEYMTGESLTEVIERNPQGLSGSEVVRLLRNIAQWVAYLHDHGIVHRDLKPGNIFLENDVLKIGDYGLAKYISASRRSGQTESVGTVHYMAPEIARGRYGKEIDLYALGVMTYEMLTGQVPFVGESPGEILMKHLTANPDLSRLDEPFRSVVARLLAKTPEERYASAQAMLTDLEDRLAGRSEDFVNLRPAHEAVPPPLPHYTAADRAGARISSVPFHISSVHGGLATARGRLRFTGDALIFEIQIEALGMFKGGVKEVRLALADLESVSLRQGWFGASLIVRALRGAALEGLPTSHIGQATLRIARQDQEAAKALVDSVAAAMSRAAHGPASPKHGGYEPNFAAAAPGAWGAGAEQPRRIYRPRHDRVLKGVCSGIARYFDVEPVVVRLLFVIVAFLTGFFPVILTYIVLAICVSSEGQSVYGRAAPRTYRIMRLSDDRVWGGVCSGWAEFFGFEPVWVRLLYAVITVLTGIFPGLLLYWLMMMIMPVAAVGQTPGMPGHATASSVGRSLERFVRVFGRLILALVMGAGIGALMGGLVMGGTLSPHLIDSVFVGVGVGLVSSAAIWFVLCRSIEGPHRLWPGLASLMIGAGTGLAVGGLSDAIDIAGSEEVAIFAGVGSGLAMAGLSGFWLFTSLLTPLRWRWFFIVVFLGVGAGLLAASAGVALQAQEEAAVLAGVGAGFLTAGILTALLFFGKLSTHLSNPVGSESPPVSRDIRQTQTWYAPSITQSYPRLAGGAVILAVLALGLAAGTSTYWMHGDVPSLEVLLAPRPRPVLVESEVQRLKGHAGSVTTLAVSHDGKRLASGAEDGNVQIWSMSSFTSERKLEGRSGPITCIAYSPDDQLLAVATSGRQILVWDLNSGEQICQSVDHRGSVHSVAFNHDGTLLATGCDDDIVRFVDARTGEQVRQFFGFKNQVHGVAISPNGQILAAVGDHDNSVRTWDVATGRPLRSYQASSSWLREVGFSPDGRELAARDFSGVVEVWDLTSNRRVRLSAGSIGESNGLAFTPDGSQLAMASHRGLKLLDIRTGRLLAQFSTSHFSTRTVAFSVDGELIASGHDDGTIRLWEVPVSVRKHQKLILALPGSDPEPFLVEVPTPPEPPELTIPVESDKPGTLP